MAQSSLIHSIYEQIFKVWRAKRHAWFLATIQPNGSTVILDVGGYPKAWLKYDPVGARIDCLNVDPVEWKAPPDSKHPIHFLVGDGCALPFDDASYDIGYSNSVIEHVGSFERQQAFAKEIRRIGKRVWVQTPARECPIEPHYLAPLIHYLPRSVQRRIIRWLTPWGWLQRPSQKQIDEAVESTRLISYREMKQLFPDCKIIIERMLFVIPKSYIAFRMEK